MDNENDILSVADVAAELKMRPSEVLKLFQSGEIPGRRIGERWYLTRRQLIDYIEHGEAAPAKPPPSPMSATTLTKNFPNAPRADHSWVCEHCHCVNDAERVSCQDCARPRLAPLINYVPFRRSL